MKRSMIWAAVVAAAALPMAAPAQHSDVEVEVDGGALVVPQSSEGFYVFEGHLGEFPLPANQGDEPGFEVDDGQMNENEILGFNMLNDLLYWDGTQFDAIPAGHSMTIESVSNSISVAATGAMPGFDIGTADVDGGIHQHLDFTLEGPGAPDGLAVGAYGLWMEVTSPSYNSSNPFIIMLNYGLDDAAFEAGVDAASTFVPEPTSAALLAVGGLLMLRRRIARG